MMKWGETWNAQLVLWAVAIILMLTCPCKAQETVSYAGYQLIAISFNGSTSAHQALVDYLTYNATDLEFDLVTDGGPDETLHLMIYKDSWDKLKDEIINGKLNDEKYTMETHIKDMEKVIQQQKKQQAAERANGGKCKIKSIYLTYDEAVACIKQLEKDQPKRVKVTTFGKTLGERDLLEVRITRKHCYKRLPVIWIESTAHAREWITLATTLNVMDWLANARDADAKWILNHYNAYINPIANPDGYVYSHTTDRLWRKNRNVAEPVAACVRKTLGFGKGVDTNRNWQDHWKRGVVVPQDVCKPSYSGKAALSERETSLFDAQMKKTKEKKRKLFLAIHSYSQVILVPWAWTKPPPAPANIAELNRVAKIAEVGVFRSGNSGDMIGYNSPGVSRDHGLSVLKFTYSYGYELHPANKIGGKKIRWGGFGFLLPARRIPNVFKDFKKSFVAMVKALKP